MTQIVISPPTLDGIASTPGSFSIPMPAKTWAEQKDTYEHVVDPLRERTDRLVFWSHGEQALFLLERDS